MLCKPSTRNKIYKMTLTDKIINLVEQAKTGVARVVNSAMVCTNYLIGKLIVEEYQQGEMRAEYGTGLLQNVSAELTDKLGKGYSVQNLERMRHFFLIYSKSSKELRNSEVFQKSSNCLRIFETPRNPSTLLRILNRRGRNDAYVPSSAQNNPYPTVLSVQQTHFVIGWYRIRHALRPADILPQSVCLSNNRCKPS